MKKIFYMMFVSASFFIMSCTSNGPTGNGEKDAKTFVKELMKDFHANDAEGFGQSIDLYYDYYKDKAGTPDFNLFFKAVKQEIQSNIKDADEEYKFGKMVQETDKYGKMDMLYQLYKENN